MTTLDAYLATLIYAVFGWGALLSFCELVKYALRLDQEDTP